MQTLTDIKQLLESRGLSPRKMFGQNFLIDHNLIRKLVDASGVKSGDLVLEIGPGTGALTDELVARACRVVACELDRELAKLLRDRFAPAIAAGSFTLIEGDCLESKRAISAELLGSLAGRAFTLVANLPYNAATPLMLALLCDHPQCAGLHVTIQKEVADRLTAKPGTKDFGPLGVVAQAVGEVKLVATLPPECFWPRPDVTSAMVSIVRRARPLTNDARGLADFAQRAFSQRRKQLGSVLGRTGSWPAGILPTDRAEQLSVEQFIALQLARKDAAPTPRPIV